MDYQSLLPSIGSIFFSLQRENSVVILQAEGVWASLIIHPTYAKFQTINLKWLLEHNSSRLKMPINLQVNFIWSSFLHFYQPVETRSDKIYILSPHVLTRYQHFLILDLRLHLSLNLSVQWSEMTYLTRWL